MTKKLDSFYNRPYIYLIKSALEDAGISCFIKNEFPPAAGELPPIVSSPELWIKQDDQYKKAEEISQIFFANQEKVSPEWICPNCGEPQEGQFSQCWQCGTFKK